MKSKILQLLVVFLFWGSVIPSDMGMSEFVLRWEHHQCIRIWASERSVQRNSDVIQNLRVYVKNNLCGKYSDRVCIQIRMKEMSVGTADWLANSRTSQKWISYISADYACRLASFLELEYFEREYLFDSIMPHGKRTNSRAVHHHRCRRLDHANIPSSIPKSD